MTTYLCSHVYVSFLLERLIEIKIEKESRPYCINKYDKNCALTLFVNILNNLHLLSEDLFLFFRKGFKG